MTNIDGTPPAAVIFDLDGTLVDSEPLTVRAWYEISAHLDVPPPADLEGAGGIGGTVDERLEHLRAHTGLAIDELYAAYWQRLERIYAEDLVPIGPVYRLAVTLRRSGTPIAIASNSRRARVEATMRLALPDLAGVTIVAADEVPRPKPAPDMLLRAAELLAVAPAHCLFIDDSPVGVRAAEAAGMTCAHLFAPATASR